MSSFSSPASSSARRNDCASSITALRSGVTGPSDNPTPTMHTGLCTAGKLAAPGVERARRTLRVMRMDDMILVSVDDHVVEPPDLFEKHVPAKYKDIAPRIEHMPDGTDRWRFLDFDIPNVGLNAVDRAPARGIRHGPDELRRAPARHLRRARNACSTCRRTACSAR